MTNNYPTTASSFGNHNHIPHRSQRPTVPLAKLVPKEPEPKNNDGRETCYWCGAATRKAHSYDVCTNKDCAR